MVTLKNKLLGLDTNIFIYYLQADEEFGSTVKKIFELLAKNQARAITSVITYLELLSISAEKRDIEILQSHFLETPNLLIQDINQSIASEAAKIRREYGFRTPDAIQLAVCLKHNADFFITNDQKIKSFKEIPVILLSQSPQIF